MVRETAGAVGLVMMAGVAAADADLDCAETENVSEDAICASPSLLALDRELDRLLDLATEGSQMSPARRQTLQADQQSWDEQRDACGPAGVCLRDSYAKRIHALRAGYADTRRHDGAGISLGPFAFKCDGPPRVVSAVFVKGEAPLVSLVWRDTALVLPQVPAASGARYEATDAARTTTFWNKGDEATLSLPGRDPVQCAEAWDG